MAAKHLSSPDNPLIKRFRRVAAGRRESAFLLEGRHLLEEALTVGWPLEAVLLEESLWESWRPRLGAAVGAEKVFVGPRRLIQAAGTVASPEGVVALAERRAEAWPTVERDGLYLFLDGVQDPVNVGILVRSARAFGIAGVFAGAGTADPYHPTVLARSAGAALHLAPVAAPAEAVLEWCAAAGVTALAAEADGAPWGGAVPPGRPALLAVGNEGRGLSEAVLNASAHRVAVSMAAGWESLNVAVAGSLLMAVLSGHLGQRP